MLASTQKKEWTRFWSKFLALLMLSSLLGCSQERSSLQAGISKRILPKAKDEKRYTANRIAQVPSGTSDAGAKQPESPRDEFAELQASNSSQIRKVNFQPEVQTFETPSLEVPTMALPEAIALAFQQQPRLRVYLETVEQARRGEDIAFAPFLPMAMAGYSVGAFNLNAGGSLPGSTFLPGLGAIPFGLNIGTGYELADFKLQWLICDFGRRMARYRQSGLAVEIAQLQNVRAYQTVSNEVSVAYYQVLRARALRKTALDAVRRAEDDLEVAKKLAQGGALEREKVLRVEVQLSESLRLLDAIESAEAIAIASLNLAIGLNIDAPTTVQENSEIPPFMQSLAECLSTAVVTRREFQVARQSIHMADEGRKVAKADFAPKIVADGALFDFQQAAPNGHADLAVGTIKLEWGLFEGGKRVAEIGVADSKVRSAMAQAESIADTIAFQVVEAYRHLMTAQRGITRSEPAVAQAEENYRLVKARAEQGDATSAEITDAESTLTRAQQDHLNSIHDYLIALVRLEYAMGMTPIPNSTCEVH